MKIQNLKNIFVIMGDSSALVDEKFERLVAGAVSSPQALRQHLRLHDMPAKHVAQLYAFPINLAPGNT